MRAKAYLTIILLLLQIIFLPLAVSPSAAASDSSYFKHPAFFQLRSQGGLLILEHFQTLQQTTSYTCGPVVLQMVTQYFQAAPLHDEMTTAEIVGCKPSRGTTVKNMRSYFRKQGWQVRSSADSKGPQDYAGFLSFVDAYLQQGVPLMVENVDWGGHWRIIIGHDTLETPDLQDDVLILADPYDLGDHLQDGYVIEAAQKFYQMWFTPLAYAPGGQFHHWVAATPGQFSN